MTRRHPQKKNTAACWLGSPEPCLAVPFPASSLRYFILCSRLSIEVRLIKNGFVLCERRSDTQEIVCRPHLVLLQKTLYAPESSSADAVLCRPAAIAEEEMSRWTGKKFTKEKIQEPSNYSTKETLFYISLGPCFAGAYKPGLLLSIELYIFCLLRPCFKFKTFCRGRRGIGIKWPSDFETIIFTKSLLNNTEDSSTSLFFFIIWALLFQLCCA